MVRITNIEHSTKLQDRNQYRSRSPRVLLSAPHGALKNQSPDSKILGVPVSRRMRALVYNMASRVTLYISASTAAHIDLISGRNVKPELLESWSLKIDYSRASCLGTDQKTSGLWERDWTGTTCIIYIVHLIKCS